CSCSTSPARARSVSSGSSGRSRGVGVAVVIVAVAARIIVGGAQADEQRRDSCRTPPQAGMRAAVTLEAQTIDGLAGQLQSVEEKRAAVVRRIAKIQHLRGLIPQHRPFDREAE